MKLSGTPLEAEAASWWHLLTHQPKNIHCPICRVAKAKYPRHIRTPAGYMHNAEQFGDCITADFFVFDKHGPDLGIENMCNGLVVLDVATTWLACLPTEARDKDIIEWSLDYFAQGVKVKRFYSDNEPGFVEAAKALKWRHDSSKPHDHQSNGLIEAHVGLVKDGARALLYQAGMPPICWPWAVQYYCIILGHRRTCFVSFVQVIHNYIYNFRQIQTALCDILKKT